MTEKLNNPRPSMQHKTATKASSSQQSRKLQKNVSNASAKITHKSTKYIKLEEDSFGYFVDTFGKKHNIRRFTWTNQNCIRAQIITYGARITSLHLPSRKNHVDDIVLGFDDMEGYLCNSDLHLGAVLGRVTGRIENATFALDSKQYWVSVNYGKDHCNGGFMGLDKVVWIPSVHDSKVTLSYVSNDLDEGYPGDLFMRITFELSTKNEFTIDMDAFTTKPTIVNLSNLLYFNLGGHESGPQELYKHVVSINANCHLPLTENGLPSGEILNVIYTNNDFQVPKVLKQEIKGDYDDGYDEHMCVNRGIDQGICFVARALHPPSGRILEMYSNQYGVHFSTADHFGHGVIDIPQSLTLSTSSTNRDPKKNDDDVFQVIERLHSHVTRALSIDSKTNYEDLKDLVHKLHTIRTIRSVSSQDSGESALNAAIFTELENIIITPIQAKYLEGMIGATRRDTPTSYAELEETIKKILNTVIIKDELEIPLQHGDSSLEPDPIPESDLKNEEREREIKKARSKEDQILKRTGMIKMESRMKCARCKDERIHGKGNAIYKKHGAICFQSENYPNAIYHKNFPNCVLRPEETYRHTIVYKFWIQSGDPNKWLKRNFPLPQN